MVLLDLWLACGEHPQSLDLAKAAHRAGSLSYGSNMNSRSSNPFQKALRLGQDLLANPQRFVVLAGCARTPVLPQPSLSKHPQL